MVTRVLFAHLTPVLAAIMVLVGCASPATTALNTGPTTAALPTRFLSPMPQAIVPTASSMSTVSGQAPQNAIVEFDTVLDGGDEHFDEPLVTTVDHEGNFYVLELSNQILKFDKANKFIAKWGSTGSGDGQFRFRSENEIWLDFAFDSQGNLFVTDGLNNRVQKFDVNGKFLTKWGKEGTAEGEFKNPGGIAVDMQGNVYVMDAHNARLQKFDGNGNFITKWGEKGWKEGEFVLPTDVEVDSHGNVFVSDYMRSSIEKFDSTGKFIREWKECGTGESATMGPGGLAIDTDGIVYVADSQNNCICKFTSDGKYIGAWANYGTDQTKFSGIGDLMVADNGTVYVPDTPKNKIAVFKAKE